MAAAAARWRPPRGGVHRGSVSDAPAPATVASAATSPRTSGTHTVVGQIGMEHTGTKATLPFWHGACQPADLVIALFRRRFSRGRRIGLSASGQLAERMRTPRSVCTSTRSARQGRRARAAAYAGPVRSPPQSDHIRGVGLTRFVTDPAVWTRRQARPRRRRRPAARLPADRSPATDRKRRAIEPVSRGAARRSDRCRPRGAPADSRRPAR